MFSQVNGQQNADFDIYSMSGKNFIEKSIGVVFCVATGLSFRHFLTLMVKLRVWLQRYQSHRDIPCLLKDLRV